MRFPDFLIIGAMKCGTSTLHEQLARRAGLYLSEPKEPNFFSNDENFARGLASYASLFARARRDQRCGESSTHYTKLPTYPRTVERMRRHLSDVRLVYVMRHPIDRIVSQYIHDWTEREVTGTLDDAVRQEPRYVAYSSYARQLEPFVEAYGRAAILPVAFERLTSAPDQEFARICRFIGDPTPGEPRWSNELEAQNVSAQRLRRSALRERVMALPGVRPLVQRLPRALRERAKSHWRMRERPRLSPEVRAELESRVDEDLARLGGWLGCELRCATWHTLRDEPLRWAPHKAA